MSAKSPDSIDALVGHNIRIQRMKTGISQTELADKLGVSFQQVQKYEKGTNRVGAGRLFRIADILDVSVLTLFEGIKNLQRPSAASSALTFISEPQPFRLVQAFSRIQDPSVRRSIVILVEKVAALTR